MPLSDPSQEVAALPEWVIVSAGIVTGKSPPPVQLQGSPQNVIAIEGSYQQSICFPNVPSPVEEVIQIIGGQTGGGGPLVSVTTLTSSANPSVLNQQITLTATVSPSKITVPTGTVTFLNGLVVLGTATLDPTGIATLITGSLVLGTATLTASYPGDTNFQPSISAPISQTVNSGTSGGGGATTTTLVSSVNPSVQGQTVVFTATVTPTVPPGVPTGTVSFLDGATVIGTATLDGAGTATFSTSTLSVTTHSITASYPTTGSFTGSTSSAVSQVVNALSTPARVLKSSDLTFLGYRTLPTGIDANAYGGLALRKHGDGSKTWMTIGRLSLNLWEFDDGGGTWGSTVATAPRCALKSYGNWGTSLYGINRLPTPPSKASQLITEGLYWDRPSSSLFWMYGPNYDVGQGNPYVLGFTKFTSDTAFTTYGPWAVDAGSHKVRNYMVGIPAWFQSLVGGRTLAMGAGLESGSIGSSWGPNLRAVDTPLTSTPSTTVLTSVPLTEYPEVPYQQRFNRDPQYTPVDGTTGAVLLTGTLQYEIPTNGTGYWTGSDLMRAAAWVDTDKVTGLLVAGRLGYDFGWYGQPVLTNGIHTACDNAKGENASRYETRWFIYDPANLAKVAAGQIQPWQCPATEIFDARNLFNLSMFCNRKCTGLAFDPDTNILYGILPEVDNNAGGASPGCVLVGWSVTA